MNSREDGGHDRRYSPAGGDSRPRGEMTMFEFSFDTLTELEDRFCDVREARNTVRNHPLASMPCQRLVEALDRFDAAWHKALVADPHGQVKEGDWGAVVLRLEDRINMLDFHAEYTRDAVNHGIDVMFGTGLSDVQRRHLEVIYRSVIDFADHVFDLKATYDVLHRQAAGPSKFAKRSEDAS